MSYKRVFDKVQQILCDGGLQRDLARVEREVEEMGANLTMAIECASMRLREIGQEPDAEKAAPIAVGALIFIESLGTRTARLRIKADMRIQERLSAAEDALSALMQIEDQLPADAQSLLAVWDDRVAALEQVSWATSEAMFRRIEEEID